MLQQHRYGYHDRIFDTLQDMVNILFSEVDEQLKQLEIGEIENIRMNRREITWKLFAIDSFKMEQEFQRYILDYNRYWSRLYYLEYASGEKHPYLKSLRQKLIEQSKLKKE